MHSDTITTKRIGYLRMAQPSDAEARKAPSAPITSMWRKLAAIGLIETTKDGTFRRTTDGEKVLDQFDRDLPENIRLVLNAVKAEISGAAVMKGMIGAINSGLVVHVDTKPNYRLTHAGSVLADPIGAEGYFEKSGNLVRVLSLCTDKGYEGHFDVERLDGESKGKRMLVPRHAFHSKEVWQAALDGLGLEHCEDDRYRLARTPQ